MTISETIQNFESLHDVAIYYTYINERCDKITIIDGPRVNVLFVHIEDLPRLETILETAISKLQNHINQLESK